MIREIQAKTLLSSVKTPDPWFGIKYTMNLYRGCGHHCIYCDSRSECYQIEDFDGEILVKTNALELLHRELPRKRVKGYISTGSMNDAYMPVEADLCMTRRALEIIAEYHFPVHILTKSDLVVRDLDLLAAINESASGGDAPTDAAGLAGAVVSFTVTTTDDDLAAKIEPGAPPPSRRLAALAAFAQRGIRTGIMLMPVLPFIEDTVENIRSVVTRAHEYGAGYVVAGFGITLRDRQRAYYYRQLDRLFPGLTARYQAAYGDRYSARAQGAARLEAVFKELMARCGMEQRVAPYRPAGAEQLALFPDLPIT